MPTGNGKSFPVDAADNREVCDERWSRDNKVAIF
jgi:hypothetical protein